MESDGSEHGVLEVDPAAVVRNCTEGQHTAISYISKRRTMQIPGMEDAAVQESEVQNRRKPKGPNIIGQDMMQNQGG